MPETDTLSPGSQEVLPETLRANRKLLCDLAMRYEVNTPGERPECPTAINNPQSIHNLVGPEMQTLAQEQLRVLPTLLHKLARINLPAVGPQWRLQ